MTTILLAGWLLAAPAAEDFAAETRAWRERRIERLRSETGWLSLVGLHWLEEGENAIGTLPGTWILEGGRVRVKADPALGLTVDGKAVGEASLVSDLNENPSAIRLGEVRAQLIERGERFAIRVRDPKSPVRAGFKGIDTYPPDARFRIVAEWEPYATPKEIDVPNVLGTVDKARAPGVARFTVNGVPCALEPILEEGDTPLFFIFKDATSGKETYPAGRFLYAAAPKDGKVVLDFNRAYNPPCAFTPYATCPLPPKHNRLTVAIEAGEKTWH
ncbi:MAG TPA: DUF1684 domain-containing protein [Candidatus Polarisedimenticolaceae bacterium]